MFERGEEATENVVYLHKYIEEHNIHIDSAWGLHPVSYTHLSERDRKMTIRLTPFMSCSAKLPIYSVFTPVSYTHLDVYKRQE